MIESPPLTGLVAATHTPFHADGSLNLGVVEAQAAHLARSGVGTVFIGGSTGEYASLTLRERLDLAARWMEVVRGATLRVVVHVGSNCLEDSRALAAQAERLGAAAISALAPSYFKPRSTGLLVESCARIAEAAPATPFYYYDIPALTGVNLSSADFLAAAAERIPTLRGIKFTHWDLMTYQYCLRTGFDLPYGMDEQLLAALAMGAHGAVGSGFNFAAPVYGRLLEAFGRGDMEGARREQFRGVQLVAVLARRGYMGSAKALMGFLGVEVGPARLPNASLDAEEARALRTELETLGFFEWIR